eukprot:15309385-Alexandrium_andersonii.AAC.1
MLECCMHSGISEGLVSKSRNLGSIHPTSSRGGDLRGPQEVFMHVAQGTGAGCDPPLVFLIPSRSPLPPPPRG